MTSTIRGTSVVGVTGEPRRDGRADGLVVTALDRGGIRRGRGTFRPFNAVTSARLVAAPLLSTRG